MTDHKWFSIGAPEYDASEVETRVIERMLHRMPQALMNAESTGALERLEKAIADVWDALDNVSVQVSVRDERLPIGNSAWNRIKAQFHALTVLYVNELAGRQNLVNSRIVAAMDALAANLTAETERREHRIHVLEIEIARLRDQVNQLSQRQD